MQRKKEFSDALEAVIEECQRNIQEAVQKYQRDLDLSFRELHENLTGSKQTTH